MLFALIQQLSDEELLVISQKHIPHNKTKVFGFANWT